MDSQLKLALETQTNFLYEAFKKAVETREKEDTGIIPDEIKALRKIFFDSGYHYLNREENRDLDKYALQLMLINLPSTVLDRRGAKSKSCWDLKTTPQLSNTNHLIKDLKQAVDSNTSYDEIEEMAVKLAYDSNFDGIVKILDYVREK